MGSDASRPLQDDKLDICVYHERQKSNLSLCGVHVINNLLQRPAVTTRDLDRVARSSEKVDSMLDRSLIKSPRKKFAFQSWASAGKRCPRTDKENRIKNSNCSIQVLQKALRPFGACLVPAGHPELASLAAWGYVVHCEGHWSAMRQVGEHELWVDLDSNLKKPALMSAPEVLRLQVGMPPKSGGVVFAVVGTLPPCPEDMAGSRHLARLSVNPHSVCRTHFNL